MAWVSVLHKEVDSAWVSKHITGFLDISNANIEITTIPFVGNINPEPKATTGMCKTS